RSSDLNRRQLRQRTAVLPVDGLRNLGRQQLQRQHDRAPVHERDPRLAADSRAGAGGGRPARRVLREARALSGSAMTIAHHQSGDPQTVTALVDARAADRGDAVYLVDADTGRTLSFSALQASCRRIGALLDRHGVARGDNVAVVMPNGVATVRLLLGAMYAGRAVVPVNLLSQPEQMRYVLGHAGCRLVFASAEWAARLRELLANDAPVPTIVQVEPDADAIPGESVVDLPSSAAAVAPAQGDLALLMYTSGTTGQPKGVMLTHGNLAANAHAISREHLLGPQDRVAAGLPVYNLNAIAVTMRAPIAHSGSLVVAARFSAARFWDTATSNGCTWINVVPTISSYLLEGAAPPRDALAGIRFCRS